MALRVKCKCGRKLSISAKYADKRLACPVCKSSFTIPRAKFVAAGALPAAAKPPTPPPIPESPPTPPPVAAKVESSQQPVEFGLDAAPAELSDSFVVPADELTLSADDSPPAAHSVDGEPAATLSYADGRPQRVIPGRKDADVVQGPKRGYWADAFMSFAYPFLNVNNVITFIVTLVISLLRIPLGYVGCYGLAGTLIIVGWLYSLYFSVIADTASGSEDLPGIRMENGFLDDIIKPAMKYIGSFAVALLPGVTYTLLWSFGAIPPALQSGVALLGWLALGFFAWPMVVMLFAFDALDQVFRIDLIITTIFRTIGAYLSV